MKNNTNREAPPINRKTRNRNNIRLRRGPHRTGRHNYNKTNSRQNKQERLRQIGKILKKKESLRSNDEVVFLTRMKDEVKLVKRRLGYQQKRIDRSKEFEDEISVLKNKCKKLAAAIQNAEHLIVYTGAGISTAADIPDYRGPNGIWTLLQQGKNIGKHDLTKSDPTLTHMALWELYRKHHLKFVVSQNCDGLHLRSGLPRRVLSEVHGNMYIEMCQHCKPNLQYWRLFDTTERTARYYHKTGRICHKCGTPLIDSIVHFGEKGIAKWPLNWPGALHHAAKADVILCLGSSLKVLKKYPWLWAMDKPVKKRPDIYIVNLQWTPKDLVAALKINGKCDTVMKLVMDYLELDIPKYERYKDPIFAHTSYLSPKELHTTTQPMLVRLPLKNVDSLEETAPPPSSDCEKSPKSADGNDSDEDCPLNLLKEKMYTNGESLDLSIPKKRKLGQREWLMEQRRNKNFRCLRSPPRNVRRRNIEETEVTSDSSLINNSTADELSVKMENGDFSCTVNLEENKSSSTIHASDSKALSNLKINAVINTNTDRNSQNNCAAVEEISMEILAQEFERVHVEMKTNENEIHKVSILLVNKTRPSPIKCNKFQQTDELIDTKCEIVCKMEEDLTSQIDGALFNQVDIKKEECPSVGEPLDFSRKPEQEPFSNTFHLPDVKPATKPPPCILRVPKPILSLRLAQIKKQTSLDDALDLRTRIQKESTEKLKPLFSIPTESMKKFQKEHSSSYNVFKKRFQALTRVIMENAIMASREELQYAYSGIHSIIDPMPFFVQYDFKSVFRSINFIRLGQKLLSNNKIEHNTNNNKTKETVETVDRSAVMTRRQKIEIARKKSCGRVKKPACQFCYDHYTSYACNFYPAYNSDDRYEKLRNGKLIMCECCDMSETEEETDSEEEETLSNLKERNEECERLKDCDSSNNENMEDLDNSVQISGNIKLNSGKENLAQAGWFGKGFRKNRRRKK